MVNSSSYSKSKFLAFVLSIFWILEFVSPSETTYEGINHIVAGRTITIKCSTLSTRVLKWSKDKNDIFASERINITESKADLADGRTTSTLTIKDATTEDEGEYKCYQYSDNSHKIVIISVLPGVHATSSVLPGVHATSSVLPGVHATSSGIASEEESKFVEVGDTFSLHCNFTTGITTGVIWSKGEDVLNDTTRIKIYENNTIEVSNTVDEDAGVYMCRLDVPDVTQNFTFDVSTKPRILDYPTKSVNQVQGDKLSLKCKVAGNPIPNVRWLKGLESIDNNSRIDVIWNSEELFSNLVIQDLVDEDRAEYSCVAENIAGSVNSTTLVRVKDKLAALWPFLGIVGEVGVLCTIIFIYEKRRTKQEFEESDTDQSPDTKNVSDNKEKDVRQRK